MTEPGIWYIHRINVPRDARGQGRASMLLQNLLDDADREGVTLELHPIPSDGLNFESLAAWYTRKGFEVVTPGTWLMRRTPKCIPSSV